MKVAENNTYLLIASRDSFIENRDIKETEEENVLLICRRQFDEDVFAYLDYINRLEDTKISKWPVENLFMFQLWIWNQLHDRISNKSKLCNEPYTEEKILKGTEFANPTSYVIVFSLINCINRCFDFERQLLSECVLSNNLYLIHILFWVIFVSLVRKKLTNFICFSIFN